MSSRAPTADTAFTAARPIRPIALWRDVVDGEPRNFCCAGCLAVAQTITAAGLAGFYASRTADAVRPAAEAADEWTRWDESAAAAGLVHDGRSGSPRGGAAARRPDLRRLRVAARDVARAAAGRGEARVNFANRRARRRAGIRGETRLSQVLRAVAAIGYRAHPYDPARSEALARARTARAAAAHGGGAAGDDAGDDVRASGLPVQRRRRAGTAAPARLGELRADAAGARLFGRAVLPRRVARCRARRARHGRAGRARHRRGVRRQRVGDVHRRGRRVLRFRDDVHRAAAGGALRRTGRAAEGRRRDRSRRAAAARDRRAPACVARRCAVRRSVAAAQLACRATSCSSVRARSCRPTARSSTAARMSRKRC